MREVATPVKYRSLFVLLIALAVSACAAPPAGKSVSGPRAPLSEVKLEPETAQAMINAYRAQRGLGALRLEKLLTRAAQLHAGDLAKGDRLSHTGSDGSDPWTRVKAAGYRPQLAAENVGVGQRSFAELLRGWKDSPGHNKNLLVADATQMGIALVTNPRTRYKTFWVLVLGNPARSQPGS